MAKNYSLYRGGMPYVNPLKSDIIDKDLQKKIKEQLLLEQQKGVEPYHPDYLSYLREGITTPYKVDEQRDVTTQELFNQVMNQPYKKPSLLYQDLSKLDMFRLINKPDEMKIDTSMFNAPSRQDILNSYKDPFDFKESVAKGLEAELANRKTERLQRESEAVSTGSNLSAPKNTAGAILSGTTALLGIGAAIGDVIETRNRQKAIDKMSAYQVVKPPKVEVSPVKSRTEEIRSSHEANVDRAVKTGMYAASRAGATEHIPGLIAKRADASTQIAGTLAGHQTQVDAANAQAKQRADEFNAQMTLQQGSINAQMANQMLGMQQQLALANRTNAPKYLMQTLQEGYGYLTEQDAKKKGHIQNLMWAYENMPYSANKGVLYDNLLRQMGINLNK